jgi:hypothetical protein
MKLRSARYSAAENNAAFYSNPVLLFSIGRFAERSGPAPYHSRPATDCDRCLLRRFKTSYFFHRGVMQL